MCNRLIMTDLHPPAFSLLSNPISGQLLLELRAQLVRPAHAAPSQWGMRDKKWQTIAWLGPKDGTTAHVGGKSQEWAEINRYNSFSIYP